jgi:hypothetical protein
MDERWFYASGAERIEASFAEVQAVFKVCITTTDATTTDATTHRPTPCSLLCVACYLLSSAFC